MTVLAFRRVIALTSIDAGSLAGDLAERMVPVELQRITPDRRRPDADVAADYRQAQPATLAALLDLLAGVLAALPTVELAELPRMADFARMLAALDTVTGWNSLAAYQQRTNESNHAVVESDPFATAITAMVKGTVAGWAGTIAELLATITPEHPPRGWPRTNRAAGGHLRRISPALRACGINVEATKSNGERIFRLTPDQEAPPVQGAWIEQPLQTLPGP